MIQNLNCYVTAQNKEIKSETHYTSPSGDKIQEKSFVKDLGVLMSNDCLFKDQIDSTIEKAKNLISWIREIKVLNIQKSHFLDIKNLYLTFKTYNDHSL